MVHAHVCIVSIRLNSEWPRVQIRSLQWRRPTVLGRCAVIGTPDEKLGEMVTAVVSPQEPRTGRAFFQERVGTLDSSLEGRLKGVLIYAMVHLDVF